ncbi:probable RTT103 Regulator of Ty1 Transposition [Phialocephala subalpina]|uniref:Probable RTT103 Regulator of Ty1 Transposition n=1 Tax=Phialocephala subalpina TaxID=576137 RepID=A0A1L7XY01_9HELO|nr:probable RTT103 Regulator of Ty1 Transposition [Phialocephala subalpina]
MAYTDDAVLAKLSALNETQESIVTVAQWVMFHRRHADRTGQLWLQRLKDSGSNKRLNLIYLANEVAQQSKARKKDDFLIAFSPIIAEATATAYKGATNEVQQKLRRVVEVWRQRQIFEIPIQDAIEARIDELDKTRSSGKRSGESIFSANTNSVPKELVPIVSPQQLVTKLVLSTKTSVNAANQDYDKLTGPSAVSPSAPVHAARLNGLLKTLANAEGAVAESIKARKLLIEGLEKILDTNRASLAADEAQISELSNRRTEIDNKKRDVEENIMRGFATNSNPSTPVGVTENSPGNGAQHSPVTPAPEPDRPEVEALTPPGYPQPPVTEPIPEYELNNGNSHVSYQQSAPAPPGSDLLSSLSTSYGRSPSAASGGSIKKRKLNDNDFPDLGGDDGLDADVAEMLRRDSGGAL